MNFLGFFKQVSSTEHERPKFIVRGYRKNVYSLKVSMNLLTYIYDLYNVYYIVNIYIDKYTYFFICN